MTKIFMFIFALFLGSHADAVIPKAHSILEQIIQKNPVKNIKTVQINAVLTEDKNSKNIKLNLSSSGLQDNNKQDIKLFILDILFKHKNIGALEAYLKSIGVNTNIISLGFFANEPIYIIGAQPADLKSPQIWVDKYHGYIVKEIGKNHEVIFDKYFALPKNLNAKFPRLIFIKNNNTNTNFALGF